MGSVLLLRGNLVESTSTQQTGGAMARDGDADRVTSPRSEAVGMPSSSTVIETTHARGRGAELSFGIALVEPRDKGIQVRFGKSGANLSPQRSCRT